MSDYLPAEDMLRLVEPILDAEFPLLPVTLRKTVIDSIPHRAGCKEAPYLKNGEFLETERRLELWAEALREGARDVLAHYAPQN